MSNVRLIAVDLRNLSDEEMAALRQEAIRIGVPLEEHLVNIVADSSARLVARDARRPAPATPGS